MKIENKKYDSDLDLRGYTILAFMWTMLMVLSSVWNINAVKEETLNVATAALRANLHKDLSFRRWATSHGGVYVKPTEHTPPNPYLKAPDRDVITTKGQVLTLMNPAYILRQIQEDYPEEFGVKSRITSLKPLNPKNFPDDWESIALKRFDHGEKEIKEVRYANGKPVLRLMRPLFTEQGCLKCHAFQGYKVGDVRGGISSLVPLESFQVHENKQTMELFFSHLFIWLTGLTGLTFWYQRNRRLDNARITSDLALRESENRYRSLIQSSPVCIHEIGMDGRITSMNKSGLDMMGMKEECEVQGFLYLDAVCDADRERIGALLNKAYAGETSYFEFKASGPKGPIFKSCFVPIKDEKGNIEKLMGITEDIGEQRVAENALITLKNELEKRVVDRTARLETANKELESFSYSISHDLRTPLRAIDGFSLILLEDYGDKLDDEAKRLLNVVRNNTVRMSNLIDDILRLSRTGRIEMFYTDIDINALIQEILGQLKPQIESQSAEIKTNVLPKAFCDKALMRQVFQNLILNALKFSSKKEASKIEIGGKIEGQNIIYYVKDNGVGFNMNYVDKLFGVFQRLHGVDEFEGTGIGLAIVKRIIARHGGTAWAEGEIGKGATFYISIPDMNVTKET